MPAPKAPSNRDVERWYAAARAQPARARGQRHAARARRFAARGRARADGGRGARRGRAEDDERGGERMALWPRRALARALHVGGGRDHDVPPRRLRHLVCGRDARLAARRTRRHTTRRDPGSAELRRAARRLAGRRARHVVRAAVRGGEVAGRSRVPGGEAPEGGGRGLAYYHLHRAAYKTKPKYTVEYVSGVDPAGRLGDGSRGRPPRSTTTVTRRATARKSRCARGTS